MSAAAQASTSITCPQRITVEQVVSSRYPPSHERPENWADRLAGQDLVRSSDGQLILLQSDGGQSPPQVGWQILLREGNAASGYEWTLVGMPKGCELTAAQQR
jgi:hypothetical protein